MRRSPYTDPGLGPGGTQAVSSGHEPVNLGDILERVLDRGIVIVGDIRVSLLDIELLTLKLRLVVASVETAREMGIDWWEHDPWINSKARDPVPPDEERAPLESTAREPTALESAGRTAPGREPAGRAAPAREAGDRR